MLSLFALHASNRFVHITEVERGLACDCRCSICGDVVLARQGDKREHHFAHSPNIEPCASNYESDLHRFAKRVILEAGGLVVPVTAAVAQALGFGDDRASSILLACANIKEEVAIDDRRPDLLATTTDGVGVAIEIAYSSFCDLEKRRAYENMQLPALEIDLRAFTPSAFDVTQVKRVVLENTACKYWLWPVRLEDTAMAEQLPTLPPAALAAQRQFLPEEIVTMRGRWISIKELPSGDIAIKAVRFDPEIVSAVRTVARAHYGRYRQTHHNWVIPHFRAEAARAQLRAIASAT